MAENIKIQLQDIYEPITQEDVRKAKDYVLRREAAARSLSSLIDSLMEDAAAQITIIAYRYGIDPERFQLASSYNEKMMEEVSTVLDELEDDILDLTLSYATKCTDDKEDKNLLALWVLALGRNNQGLRKTLENRLWMLSRDIEAMLVATKSAKYNSTKAIQHIKSYLHTVYTMPEMKPLFRMSQKYKATYIRSKGIKYGNVGSSNSEANNIVRFGRTTVQMGWMHYQQQQAEDDGAAGYWVGRGSEYPCRICDENCGFHTIDEGIGLPVHPSCQCYAIPVYLKDIEESLI